MTLLFFLTTTNSLFSGNPANFSEANRYKRLNNNYILFSLFSIEILYLMKINPQMNKKYLKRKNSKKILGLCT